MTPYHTSERAIFYNGNSLLVLPELAENSVDSIVCDPPYEIGFMQKKWDSSGIAYDVNLWRECLRVLKPGGHLLAFGGTRTYHRLACAVEDAGFDVRDQIGWCFGSGFPKSLDVSKAIDKSAGAERSIVGRRKHPTLKNTDLLEESANASHGSNVWSREWDLTAPTTDAAKQWEGWGTALKPAWEPVCVARKPFKGTVVSNVLKYGTGALNIGACRIEGEPVPINRLEQWSGFGQEKRPDYEQEMNTAGRWPANLIHDGSDEVLSLFPDTTSGTGAIKQATGSDTGGNSGAAYGSESRVAGTPMLSYGDSGSASRFFYCAKDSADEYIPNYKNNVYGEGMGGGWHPGFGDEGSSARFFYTAKADGSDRNEGCDEGSKNDHPTVKPTSLMRYLCRLVTRPGGTVLDPFMGSGSTYKAAYQEGFHFIGIEIHEPYCAIAVNRISQTIFNFTT